MPSHAYRKWRTGRATELDQIARAHTGLGGTGPGHRQAAQQVNRAYAVLLAAHFQGFCRDLHEECVGHILRRLGSSSPLEDVVRAEFLRNLQLSRGNAQSGNLGADFGRLGLDLWTEVYGYHPGNARRRALLDELNVWRNAIAHQDLDPSKLGGTTTLRLGRVRRWRVACQRLARSFDEVLAQHLQVLTGRSPW